MIMTKTRHVRANEIKINFPVLLPIDPCPSNDVPSLGSDKDAPTALRFCRLFTRVRRAKRERRASPECSPGCTLDNRTNSIPTRLRRRTTTVLTLSFFSHDAAFRHERIYVWRRPDSHQERAKHAGHHNGGCATTVRRRHRRHEIEAGRAF